MNKLTRRALGVAGFALILTTSTSFAQQPPPVRIRGEIVEGRWRRLRDQDARRRDLKVKLVDPQRVMGLVKASLDDVKHGSYIGVYRDAAGRRQPEGHRDSHLPGFADGRAPPKDIGRGIAARQYDDQRGRRQPRSPAVDGQTITVKYKDGEKKVIVPPNTPIVSYSPGSKDELKLGAQIFIVAATKQPDGSLTAGGVNVGRDGVVPPM